MSTRLRIVTLLVLSLLLQAVAPVFACSMAGPTGSATVSEHAHHAIPADDSPPPPSAHDCCAGEDGASGCSGHDCAMGNCLSLMLPVAATADAVPVHATIPSTRAVFVPLTPPDSRFRPPIA